MSIRPPLIINGASHTTASHTTASDNSAGHTTAPGFGHPVHRHGDPRTAPLLAAVRAIATDDDQPLIERVRQESLSQPGPGQPNVDFALGALAYAARMPPQAPSAIFAVARTAGWIAHAAEEYAEHPLRFRGRAFRPAQARPGRVSPSR